MIQYNIQMFKLDCDHHQYVNFKITSILQQETQSFIHNQLQSKPSDHFGFINKQKIHTNQQYIPQPVATLIAIPAHALSDLLEVYEWRSQTEYPIVKAQMTGTILNKSQSIINIKLCPKNNYKKLFKPDQKLYLEVITQPVQLLSNFGPLSFGVFSYAFKEALVGFQRLYALFGPFSISPSMIVVNNEGRVKVWLSTNYNQNTKNQFSLESKNINQTISQNLQKTIVTQFKQVFLVFSQNNATFRQFFSFIQHTDNFLGLLKRMKEFLSMKKIITVKSIRKQSQKIIKRPLSPNFTLVHKKSQAFFVTPPKKMPFNKRMKAGDGEFGQKMLKNLRSMKNLKLVISQFQTKQSLSTKSQFIHFDQKFTGELTGIQSKKMSEKGSKSPQRMKRKDSLQKYLQNLFETQVQQKAELPSKKFIGLAAYGKTLKSSGFLQ